MVVFSPDSLIITDASRHPGKFGISSAVHHIVVLGLERQLGYEAIGEVPASPDEIDPNNVAARAHLALKEESRRLLDEGGRIDRKHWWLPESFAAVISSSIPLGVEAADELSEDLIDPDMKALGSRTHTQPIARFAKWRLETLIAAA